MTVELADHPVERDGKLRKLVAVPSCGAIGLKSPAPIRSVYSVKRRNEEMIWRARKPPMKTISTSIAPRNRNGFAGRG